MKLNGTDICNAHHVQEFGVVKLVPIIETLEAIFVFYLHNKLCTVEKNWQSLLDQMQLLLYCYWRLKLWK